MSSTAKYAPYAYAPSIKMERTLSPDGATQASALARMIEKEATSVAAMIISQQRDIEPEVGAVFARGLGDYYSRGFPE
jgi:hypothetical protein